jgi:hypothetical protein
VNVVDCSRTKILYAVIGDPLATGSDQLIETNSLKFAVVTVVGASAIKAQSRVKTSEYVE